LDLKNSVCDSIVNAPTAFKCKNRYLLNIAIW